MPLKKIFIFCIVLLILGTIPLFSTSSTAAPRDAFFEAEPVTAVFAKIHRK